MVEKIRAGRRAQIIAAERRFALARQAPKAIRNYIKILALSYLR